jgi:hypothetical protein
MAKDPEHLRLEASANLVRLIGEELVTSDEAAVSELVKNSYDAGAKQVTITIEPIAEKRPGYIKIKDDGQGMSADDFKRMFMVAGYSERGEEAGSAKRVPTGEKGIGRFAAARLGRYHEIVTKASQEHASINMTFDWNAFRDKTKKINQIPIDLNYVHSPEFPAKARGTSLVVTGLHSDWKRGKIESLREGLAQLLDPFEKRGDFTVFLNVIDSPKLSGEITQERPADADIELQFKVDSDGRVRRKIASRSLISGQGPQTLLSKIDTKPLIGLRARFLYYLKRPAKAKRKGLAAGVRVYRDGVRLEPFGSPAADWLGLSEKRARLAGHAHIVPSRLFGFVEVSRLKHEQIRDTTGRQALIDTEAAQALVSLLREQLGDLEEHVRTQVTVPRWEAGKRKKAVKLERARLRSLGMMSAGLAHEMRQPLQVIRTEAGNITTGLRRLGIEDQQIDDAQTAIDRNIQRLSTVTGMASGTWLSGRLLCRAASTSRFLPTLLGKLKQLAKATIGLANFRTPWAKFVPALSASRWKGSNCAVSVGTSVCPATSTSRRSAGNPITMPSSTSNSAGGCGGFTFSAMNISLTCRGRS